ncbi:hypothetical protein MPSEU_000205800 [Mayamaea pseudoterrestris]|nr:hypothetical protein MPSEU_000205800 [Mayamaea pseudoterrestris]
METMNSSFPERLLLSVPSRWQIPLLVGTSMLFFIAVLFVSTLSVKEMSEMVPARAPSDSVSEGEEEDEEEEMVTPKKALFDASDSDEEDMGTPMRSKAKEILGSELTPHGRRSRRLLTAEKRKHL